METEIRCKKCGDIISSNFKVDYANQCDCKEPIEMEEEIPTKMRKEVKGLSNIDLDDELQRPTDNWKEDVLRETLRRILENAK